MLSGVPSLNLMFFGSPGGSPPLQPHITDLGHRAGRDARAKSAVAQDRGFQSQLRREPAAHLRFGRRLPGLVVEDGIAAVRALLDAVGARRQREIALSPSGIASSPEISAVDRASAGAALALPAARTSARCA